MVCLQENESLKDGFVWSSKGRSRSSVHTRVQAKFTLKGGEDQSATTIHFRGPKWKEQCSYDKTPYLDLGDDDGKKTHMKEQKAKIARQTGQRKMGPNVPKKGPGRPARFGRRGQFLWRFAVPPPFDQDPLWCINSPCFRWLPHPFTRE
jgi:hypothetical protein